MNPNSSYLSLKRRNCELKNDTFSIHFTILLSNNSGIDSRNNAIKGQGIGIAILLESESTQPYNGWMDGWRRQSGQCSLMPSSPFLAPHHAIAAAAVMIRPCGARSDTDGRKTVVYIPS